MVMDITHFNPFKDLESFFSRPRFSLNDDFALQNITHSDWVPAVDINETDEEFLITVEVPQVEKDDIKIQVQNGMLSIKGERKYENEDKKAHRIERYYGSFQRSFSLPDNVKESEIHADHKNGVLYVSLPKTEEELPKRLEIEIH
jgi:HSP20 family protein